MSKINLASVLASTSLTKNEIAAQLYPGRKHPQLALNRVLAGEADLDSEQISKLSLLTGIPIPRLFTGGSWTASTARGTHTLTSGSYRAELDTRTWITKIFHNGSLCHESILHSGVITLSEYISLLDIVVNQIIKKK